MEKNELEQIKTQLAQLEKHFSKEINFLRARVSEMERQLESQVIENEDIEPIISVTEQPVSTERIPTLAELLKTFQEKERSKKSSTVEELGDDSHKVSQPTTEDFDGNSHKKRQAATEKIELPAFITDLFLPLAQFRTMLEDTYTHYKAQNRLPVFFMTLGGVIALLLGFSYLMQFIPDVYFEVFKISGSFLASFGILFGGLVLHKKEEKYHEFGSALLGLGIAINFLILYYLSDSTIFPIFANILLI